LNKASNKEIQANVQPSKVLVARAYSTAGLSQVRTHLISVTIYALRMKLKI
jgi:hypothetical protein